MSLGQMLSHSNLFYLNLVLDQVSGPYYDEVLLVSSGQLVNGTSYASGEFAYTWDPPNGLSGLVDVRADAQNFAGGSGQGYQSGNH